MKLELFIGYLTVLFSEAVFVLCYKKLAQHKLCIKKYKIILWMVLSAITMINNIFNIYSYKVIISYLIIFFQCKIWYNDNNKKTLYYSIILSALSIFIEIVLVKLLSFNYTSFVELNQSLLAKSALTIIFSASLYFVISVKLIKKFLQKYESQCTKIFSTNVLICILIIISNLLLMQVSVDYKSSFNYLFIIIIFLFIITLFIFLFKSNFKKINLQIKTKFLQENIKNYEVIADDYSELKHNLNHDFMAIRSVANEEAQILIDEIIRKYNKNYSWTTNIGKIPKGIQGIVCIKLYEINKENINIEVNSKIDEQINKKIKPKLYSKLCDTLGITIDNAITSARKSKEKSIYIDMQEINNNLEIKIMNTFKDELDLEMLGTRNYSTKKKKSGIGLHYLNKIIKKDFYIKKEIINNIFIVSLLVSLK